MTDAPTLTPPVEGGDAPAAKPEGKPASSVRDVMSNSAAPAAIESAQSPAKGAPDPLRDAQNAPADLPDWAQGVPEHMRADTPEATLAKVLAGYQGFRAERAKGQTGGDVPEKSDGYKWDLPEKYMDAAGGDVSADPLIAKFADLAHEGGVGQETANRMLSGVLETALEHGLVEAPMTMEQYYEPLGGEEQGAKVAGDVGAWAKNLMMQGAFGPVGSDEEKAAAQKHLEKVYDMAADDPGYLQVLDMMRRAQGAPGMTVPSANADSNALTLENLRKEQADPRYDSNSAQFEPAYRDRVDARFAEFDRRKAG